MTGVQTCALPICDNTTDLETLITQSSLDLLQEPQMLINDFFNNISTEYALEESIIRNHNSLEYLISEYLQYYEFFKDLIVYYDDGIIYKYSQFYSTSIINFEYEKKLRNNDNVTVEFVFDLAMLQSELNKMNTRMYLYYNDQFLYGKHLQNISQEDIEKYIKPYQNSSNKKIPFYNSKNLYVHTITDTLKYPLTVFIIDEPKGFNMGYLLQFLFILFFPVLFILLVVLDQVIFYKIKNSESKKVHNSNLKNIINSNLEDDNSLDWIDHWAELDDIVEKDIIEKDNINIENMLEEKDKEE